AGRIVRAEHAVVLDGRASVAGQVGAAAHQGRHLVDQGLEAGAARLAGGDLGARLPRRQDVLPAGEAPAADARLVGLTVAVPGREALLPRLAPLAAPTAGGAVEVED